jgi:hypothetical protein
MGLYNVHQVHLANKEVELFANSLLGNRCFATVFLITLYMSKLPEEAVNKDLFYCKSAKNYTERVN